MNIKFSLEFGFFGLETKEKFKIGAISSISDPVWNFFPFSFCPNPTNQHSTSSYPELDSLLVSFSVFTYPTSVLVWP